SGDVEIVLMSEDEWEAAKGKPGAPGTMKVETRGVLFNRSSGEAKTDQEVRFEFANGSGQALGAQYLSEQGALRLQRNVKLTLDQPPSPKGATNGKRNAAGVRKDPLEITGTRMDFSRDVGTIYLAGPAEAKTQAERLTAAGMLLELDKNFHAKRLTAKSDGRNMRPEFTASKGAGKLSADEIAVNFAPDGWLSRAEATGQVSAASLSPEGMHSIKAENASMEMITGTNAPKTLTLKGGVDARANTIATGERSSKARETRRVTTQEWRRSL